MHRPRPDSAFTLEYEYAGWPDALATTATNTLLTRWPNIYLYAALAESAPYLQHDDRDPLWEQKFQDAVRDARIESERALFGGTPKRPRIPVAF